MTTPNLPPLPPPDILQLGGGQTGYYTATTLKLREEAYQAGRDAGIVAAHAVLDDVGAKVQQAHDDDDNSYWSGVGAMVQAGEEAILALKSDTKEGV